MRALALDVEAPGVALGEERAVEIDVLANAPGLPARPSGLARRVVPAVGEKARWA